MVVLALWSVPRSRSTAFFRSMLERDDLLALHEPLEGLAYIGPLTIEGRTFETPESLIEWLLDGTRDRTVFLKETINPRVLDVIARQPRFLAEVRHSFLIRQPEEIAVSWFAIEHDMRIEDLGMVALLRLYEAVRDAGGQPPVVVDSGHLVARPEATMAAYCAEVGLPFIANALHWEPGERAEWERTAQWHRDASASSGFAPREHPDRSALVTSDEVVRFVAQHQLAYEQLRTHALRQRRTG